MINRFSGWDALKQARNLCQYQRKPENGPKFSLNAEELCLHWQRTFKCQSLSRKGPCSKKHDRLIGFNDTSTNLGLFYAERLGNSIHCMFTFTFFVYENFGWGCTWFCDINYSYQIQIIYTQLYGFKWLKITIIIIIVSNYSFKLLFLIRQSKMPTASFRTWTWFADSISFADYCYSTYKNAYSNLNWVKCAIYVFIQPVHNMWHKVNF